MRRLHLLTIPLVLLAISCGEDSSSELKQERPVDYSNTASGVQEDEEIVITFVGARKGYLSDKSFMSMFDPDIEVYMNVVVGYQDFTTASVTEYTKTLASYGNTPEVKVPIKSRADTQHSSGSQIIIKGSELNRVLAEDESPRDKTLYIRFYENGFSSDNSHDLVIEHTLKISESGLKSDHRSIFTIFDESDRPLPPRSPRIKSFYLSPGNTKAEFEFTVEVREIQLEMPDLQAGKAPEGIYPR